MPIVNGKHYPYTKKGKELAKKAMRKIADDHMATGEKRKKKYRMTESGKMKA